MFKRGQNAKAWHGHQHFQILVLLAFLMLIVGVLMLISNSNGQQQPTAKLGPVNEKWSSFDSSVELRPTVEFQNGTDLIWQIPRLPKAVLFLFHGCNGRAVNFWDQSPECPNGVGLPEERLIVLNGLAQRYAVVTISSSMRCWTFGKEISVVKDIIKWWIHKRNLRKLPLVAFGASSGGHFVSVLANSVKFSSIVIMIAEGLFEQMDVRANYPPTLFVHMPKDIYRQQKIDENMETLRNKGIDVSVIECMGFPLSASTLADRIQGVDQTLSANLFQLFQGKGFIDQHGYMKKDGRETPWRKAVQDRKDLTLDNRLVPYIQEELNIAFAYHEMTSLESDQIFKWFESHISQVNFKSE